MELFQSLFVYIEFEIMIVGELYLILRIRIVMIERGSLSVHFCTLRVCGVVVLDSWDVM